MNNDISFFGIRLHTDGAKDSSAIVCAVTRIYVNVQGAETTGAVISGAVSKRFDLKSAIFADEGIIIFCESFLFHNTSFLK
jgi:hypothetical protein